MHTVNVGPNLYLLGINGRTDKRCGVVTATTLQVIVATHVIHANEALSNVNAALFVGIEQWHQVLAYVLKVGLAIGRKAHEVESVEQLHVNTLLLHVECHHVGRDNLALRHNLLLKVIAESLLCKVAQVSKNLVNLCRSCSLCLRVLIELVDGLHVLCLQECRVLARTVHIAVTQIVCKLNE